MFLLPSFFNSVAASYQSKSLPCSLAMMVYLYYQRSAPADQTGTADG